MQFKDYYQVLGLEQGAATADIKKAYRKLARKFHPDVSKESNATERMKEVNEAYAVLSDQEKRAAYDELAAHGGREQPFEPPPGWHGGDGASMEDASDFFNNLFGQAGRARHTADFRTRGQDLHGTIEVSLQDAYHGAVREVSMRMPGLDAHGQIKTHQHTLNVRIPRGVRAGQHIRLKGQGGPGFGGGHAGDMFLEVRFEHDARFRVEGHDVYQNVAITPWEAALGASIEVDTPAGTMQVSVPPGSQGGRKLRLKGRGIPAEPPGNLFLVLEVVLPVPTNDAQRALYQSMAREMAFNPRKKTGESA
jgi:curved DNA-binding protein